MTDEEIDRFKAAIRTKEVYWRSVDGKIYRVIGFHHNYKEPWEEVGEPVAILSHNKTAALYNCEVEDFIEVKTLQI